MITVKCFTFNPLEENTYILFDEQLICGIIDPGCYVSAEKSELREFIKEYKLSPNYLLNTHCHLDHVFGNKFVFDNYATKLHIHEREVPVLAYAPISGREWGFHFENYNDELIFIREGDTIRIGDDELKVLFTPGHSPGHVGFYCEAQKFVIGGDVLFNGSIGRTDLPGGNHEILLKSIRDQLFTLPDDVVVYPGHGPSTTIGHEKKYNPFFR